MSDAQEPVRQRRASRSGLQDALREENAAAEFDTPQVPEEEALEEVVARARSDLRGNSRPPMRESAADAKARAAERVAQILEHGELPEEGPDEFYLDRDIIPPGWDYEWKKKSVWGKEDPAYEVQVARGGWEPVPVSRHPELMPANYQGQTIELKGMILMERPMEITKRVKMRDRKVALDQVRQKEAQLTAAPQGQFARNNKGTSLVNVSKEYEPMPVPQE